MTTTTAKLSHAVARAWARPLALTALLAAPGARALDIDLDAAKKRVESLDVVKTNPNSWRVVPSVTLRQIYTDNAGQAPDADKRGEFLTEIAPGVTVRHKSRRLDVDGLYQFHYYVGADNSRGLNRSSNTLNGNAKAELVDDLFFVDANARIFQQGIFPFSGQAVGDDFVGTNRASIRTWRVSPYVLNRFGRLAQSELRYVRDSVTGAAGLGDSSGDTLSVRLNSGPHYRDFTWGVSASDQRIKDSKTNDSRIQLGNLNLGYQLFSTLAVTAGVVYDNYDYEAMGGTNGGRGWNTGFRYTPSRRTSLQASVGRRFYGPSRSLTAFHRSRRTVWNITYDDAVVTTRANFLLASTLDPTTGVPRDPLTPTPAPAPLGDLFNPGAPVGPPVLPPVIPIVPPVGTIGGLGNTNFFSNRFFLQEQLRASVTLRGARTAAVLGAFKVQREALSVRGVDDAILGSPVNDINDNISQVGVNATLTYRLAPRTNLNLVTNVADNESLTTGFKARSLTARLLVSHQIGRNITGTAELARAQGLTGLTEGSKFTANSVSASLNIQL